MPEPSGERLESSGDVVCDAFGVGAGAVAVEVLVDVHDEVGDGAIGVLDCAECGGRAGRDKCLCAGVILAGEKDQVVRGACLTDCGHRSLNGGGPAHNVGNVLGIVVSLRYIAGDGLRLT